MALIYFKHRLRPFKVDVANEFEMNNHCASKTR